MKQFRNTTIVFLISFSPFLLKSQCASFPVVNLGNDTTVCDLTFTLDAGNQGMNFLWNTSDTTQQVNVNTSGVYSVTVTDSLGCSTGDTIDIVFNPPSVAGIISLAGGDTILCGNEPTLFYSIGPAGYVLWWVMDTINWVWAPFGSGDTLDYGPSPNNLSGVYTIMATASNGNCPADTSNILNIALHSSPEVNIGPDDTLCGYNFMFFSGYTNEQTLWSTGDTTANCPIFFSGMYTCTVTFQSGCSDTDTAYMTVYPPAVATWVSAFDTLCITDSQVQLNPGSPAGGTFIATGVTNGYFDPGVDTVGIHWISYVYTDSNGCVIVVGDTIVVDYCIAVQEWEDLSGINIYPNPADGKIFVGLTRKESTIEILSMNGQVVHTTYNSYHDDQVEVDISTLAEGIYLVRVSNETGSRYARFVKKNN